MGVLMTDTLPRLREAISSLKNRAGQGIWLKPDSVDVPQATMPPGRIVVATGQAMEANEWGNVTYDQTCMTFANAGARSQQWPAPLEGARSFLLDTHTPWTFTNGKWRGDALGYVGTATGPASQLDVPTGNALALVSLTVPVLGGRRYRIDGYANTVNVGGGIAGYAALFMSLSGMAPGIGTFYLAENYGLAPGAPFLGNGAAIYHPTGSGSTTVVLYAGAFSGLVVLRAAAQSARLTLSDLGAQ